MTAAAAAAAAQTVYMHRRPRTAASTQSVPAEPHYTHAGDALAPPTDSLALVLESEDAEFAHLRGMVLSPILAELVCRPQKKAHHHHQQQQTQPKQQR